MKLRLLMLIQMLIAVICANSYPLLMTYSWFWLLWIAVLILCNLIPILLGGHFPGAGLRVCSHGTICLKSFARATMITIVFQLILAYLWLPDQLSLWLISVLISILTLAVLFWNGMLCVYFSSVQLGIRHRAVGLLLGLVPIANLVMLGKIIHITQEEVRFELQKEQIDQDREAQQICDTRDPILLVHGVFFRDNRYINYWGRIPKSLIKNGAEIYYGNHPSALSIADSAEILAQRIRHIVDTTGCEKVNIIAHSKGGLDCRYALEHLGVAPLVASLTTVNTPHRGCIFADRLLDKIPEKIQNKVAQTYNDTLKELGDPDPDFMAAVRNLTSSHCTTFDKETPVPKDVYCQSIGSRLNRASAGKFPMNTAYHLVKYYDGENDGLVGLDSFAWGERYQLLTTAGKRGISHGDMIDMNRENIPGFDVREFYIQLVYDLKQKGL